MAANFKVIALTVDEDAGRTYRSHFADCATLPEALAAMEADNAADGYEIEPGSPAAAAILAAYCDRMTQADLAGGPF